MYRGFQVSKSGFRGFSWSSTGTNIENIFMSLENNLPAVNAGRTGEEVSGMRFISFLNNPQNINLFYCLMTYCFKTFCQETV